MDGLTSNSMRMMERSMEFLWTKQAALLDNIANAETPNYKAKLVTFEESFQESLEAAERRGVYPCGEGAGYAGGITSSAADGLRAAEAIFKKYV